MSSVDLAWRAEEACFNAWPSTHTIVMDGWLVRISGGSTRRTNSVNPTRGETFDPTLVMAEVRRLYRRAGQPVIFRVPSIAHGLDDALDRENFGAAQAETITLFAPSLAVPVPYGIETHLADAVSPGWLDARAEMTGADRAAMALFENTMSLVRGPRSFASSLVNGRIAAVAFGTLSRDLLVIEAVATHPEMRRRGLARAAVASLMTWAGANGANGACLQVGDDNGGARELYARLGFTQELYRYHYRFG